MISLHEKNGKRWQYAACDVCGDGVAWNRIISLAQIKKALKLKGWTVGTIHICAKCNTHPVRS